MSAGKDITFNTCTAVLTLEVTTSLFARLMVNDRSSRQNVDLEEVIILLHAQSTDLDEGSDTCLVVDWMGVVQECMAVQNYKTCKELSTSYITIIDSNARGYCQVRVTFANYTKKTSMKEQTGERWKGKVRILPRSRLNWHQEQEDVSHQQQHTGFTSSPPFPSAHPLQCRQSYHCNTTGGYDELWMWSNDRCKHTWSGKQGLLCNFHEGKPHHSDTTSWSWPRR